LLQCTFITITCSYLPKELESQTDRITGSLLILLDLIMAVSRFMAVSWFMVVTCYMAVSCFMVVTCYMAVSCFMAVSWFMVVFLHLFPEMTRIIIMMMKL
jgi:hypothetical protein